MLLALSLAVLVLLLSLSGWGQLLVPDRAGPPPTLFALAIVGLLPLTAFGLLVSFALPLTPWVSAVAILIGLGGFAWRWRRAAASLGDRAVMLLGLLTLLTVFMVTGAIITRFSYDTGLYHLQAISWLEHDRRVFGLANLHTRLGFNSIWFVAAAMLDVWRHGRHGVFLLNTTVYVAIASDLVQALIARRPGRRDALPVRLYAGGLLAVVLINARALLFNWVGVSPSYDMPSALLSAYAFWQFLRVVPGSCDVAHERSQDLVLLGVVCALAAMTKLSALPILLLPATAYVSLRRGVSAGKIARHPGAIVISAAVVLWLAGGLAGSGCLLFPSASSCFVGLPWAVPPEVTRRVAATVMGWARSPNADYLAAANGWDWIAAWPKTMLAKEDFIGPLGITFGAVLALLACAVAWDRIATRRGRARGQRWRLEEKACLEGLAVSAIGLLFWFFLAPDPRFGLGFFFGFVLLASCWIAVRFAPASVALHRLTDGPAAEALVAVLACLYLSVNWGLATQTARFWPWIPAADLHQIEFGPGFVAYAPRNSDQCWDAPLPCAPEGAASPALAERRLLIWRAIESGPPAR